MIDGPDVEFLLREKDYRERSPGRFLSIPAFFNGHVPVQTIRHHQGSLRQGAFCYVQTPEIAPTNIRPK